MTALPTGLLLSESILHADAFKVLATFVALNTLMYATLALMKLLPKGYAFSWFHGRNRRSQSRSIYPDPPADAPQVPHQRRPVERTRPATDEGERDKARQKPASAAPRTNAAPRTSAKPRTNAAPRSDAEPHASAAPRTSAQIDEDVRRLLSVGLVAAGRTIPLPEAVILPAVHGSGARRRNPSPTGPRTSRTHRL